MTFEKFIPPRKKKAPYVSLKRTGTITFDAAAVEAFGLLEVPGVALFFDPDRRLVGVQVMPDLKEEGTHKLTHRKRVSSVRARAFFECFGIQLIRTCRLPVTREPESGLIVLDLADTGMRPGRRRHQS